MVTLWYEDPAEPITDKPGCGIEIPKTGEPYPIVAYTLSLLCWLVAAFCAVRLVKGRGRPAMAMAGIPMTVEEPEPPAEPARAVAQATRQNTGKSKKKRKKRRK